MAAMNTKNKEHLAKELAQTALAMAGAATGALFAGPAAGVVAAGAGTVISRLLYREFRLDADQRAQLEQAFQDELLERTTQLEEWDEALRPLIEGLSWRGLLDLPTSRIYPEVSPTTLLSPRFQMLGYQARLEDSEFEDWLEQATNSHIGIAVVQAAGGVGKTRWLLEQCERRDPRWRKGFLAHEQDGTLSALSRYRAT